MHFLSWLQSHAGQALAILAACATVLGTVRNLLTQLKVISPSAGGKLGRVADWLSWIAEHGKQGIVGGVFAIPGVTSKSIAPVLPEPKLKAVDDEGKK